MENKVVMLKTFNFKCAFKKIKTFYSITKQAKNIVQNPIFFFSLKINTKIKIILKL